MNRFIGKKNLGWKIKAYKISNQGLWKLSYFTNSFTSFVILFENVQCANDLLVYYIITI